MNSFCNMLNDNLNKITFPDYTYFNIFKLNLYMSESSDYQYQFKLRFPPYIKEDTKQTVRFALKNLYVADCKTNYVKYRDISKIVINTFKSTWNDYKDGTTKAHVYCLTTGNYFKVIMEEYTEFIIIYNQAQIDEYSTDRADYFINEYRLVEDLTSGNYVGYAYIYYQHQIIAVNVTFETKPSLEEFLKAVVDKLKEIHE